MSYARIVCPVDFSEHSSRGLQYAEAVARSYQADLHILHVLMEVMPPAVPSLAVVPPAVVNDVRPATVDALHEFIRKTGVSYPAKEMVRDGLAATEIVDFAREVDADLIVMGTHGRTGIDHALVGSTTERVLRKAACPVLTIPKGSDAPGTADRIRFSHILCGVDFSPSSLRAVSHGLALAHENDDARLTLLHVLEAPSDEEVRVAADVRLGEFVEARKEEARNRLQMLIPHDIRARREPALIVELGRPGRTILRIADEVRADLIAVGAQGRGVLGLMLFGSTTHTIIRRAGCPVLTTRAAEERGEPAV